MSVLNHSELVAVCSKYGIDVGNTPECIKHSIFDCISCVLYNYMCAFMFLY